MNQKVLLFQHNNLGVRTNGGRETVNFITCMCRWFDSINSHQFMKIKDYFKQEKRLQNFKKCMGCSELFTLDVVFKQCPNCKCKTFIPVTEYIRISISNEPNK